MACVRRRRGKYVVDYYDGGGSRRWKTFDKKHDADKFRAQVQLEKQSINPTVNPRIKIDEYSEKWLETTSASVKRRTVDSYTQSLRLYILPRLGKRQVRSVHRGQIKALLADLLGSGLSRNTTRIAHATIRGMLNAAIDDGLILSNPAARLGKALNLISSPTQRQEEIKAMDRGQLQTFLSAIANAKKKLDRTYYPLFLSMARTGVRIGEAMALRIIDVDFSGRSIRVERGFSAGQFESPKPGHGRDIDMSSQLSETLRTMLQERKETWFRLGKGTIPELLFISKTGTMLNDAKIRKIFARGLKAAGLPLHYSPHSLRHTFASILLQKGHSPAYVQRQLGHSSIKLTVDTYGKWLPMGNKAAVDDLDDDLSGADSRTGSKMVASAGEAKEESPQTINSIGDPSWTRTPDPLIVDQPSVLRVRTDVPVACLKLRNNLRRNKKIGPCS